jgi:CBS domain-containing protein
MKVRELVTRHVAVVFPHDTIETAAKVMREKHVGDVVVVEPGLSGMVPIGILTDRDIVVGLVAQGITDLQHITVKDAMATDLVTAGADEDITYVLERMRRFSVRRMPVINSLEVLVGIVTYDDLVRWMAHGLANFTELFPEQQEQEKRKRA